MTKILFTNNARKMAGIPMKRKKDSKKRYHTRNNADEVIEAVLDHCNGKRDEYLN